MAKQKRIIAHLEDRILYQDDKIQINRSDIELDSHDVWVGDTKKDKNERQYFFLPRAVLKQFGEYSGPESIVPSLNAFNRNIPEFLREAGISPEYFALACARARIHEEQGYASYLAASKG